MDASLSLSRRFFYRVFRNPSVMFGVGPAILFVFGNRVFGAGATRRERFSVHFTNAGLVTALLVAHWTIGLPTLLFIELPILLVAGAVGGVVVLRATSVRGRVLGAS